MNFLVYFLFGLAVATGILEFRHMKKEKQKNAGDFCYKLKVLEGPRKDREFELQDFVIIGRGYKIGIDLFDKKVSSRHAMLVRRDSGHYNIFDLASSNSTTVNDKIIDSALLQPGDTIFIGSTTLEYITDKPASPKKQTDEQQNISPANDAQNIASPPPPLPVLAQIATEENMPSGETIVGRCASSPDTILSTNSFRQEDFEKIRQKFYFICQISNLVGIGLSLQNILKETTKALGKLFTQIERGVIFLAEEENMEPAISYNFTSKKEEKIQISSTILAETIKQRMAIMCTNAMSDDRFEIGQSIISQRIKLAMCSPLIVNDEILGVIYLDSTRETGNFRHEDLALLAAVSAQIAVFIKNVRLHRSMLQAEKLKQELTIAQEIQKNFLPSRFPEMPGIVLAAKTIPARYVGGDFYDVLQLSDNRLVITIGDVSGKGAGAALYMAGLISEFRFLAQSGLSAQETFTQLNKTLAARGTRGMFVTMLYLIIDPTKKTITYLNGGHHEPLVMEAGKYKRAFPPATSPPLGILKQGHFDAQEIPYNSGDILVLYTDGVIEAKNQEREEFDRKRLEKALDIKDMVGTQKRKANTERLETNPISEEFSTVILSNKETNFISPEQIIDHVSLQVENFCGAVNQHDDFTIVVVSLL